MAQHFRDITNPLALGNSEPGMPAKLDILRILELIRANASRIMYYSLLYGNCENQDEQDLAQAGIDRAIDGFELAVRLLTTDDQIEGIEPTSAAWVREVLGGLEGVRQGLDEFANRLRALMTPDNIPSDALKDTHISFVRFAASTFNDCYGRLLDALYSDLASQREDRLSRAKDVETSARDAIYRIDRISKKVGLISVNAAIEAARVGDAGRGFGIIAGEIRSLSDDIADASTSVQSGIGHLMREMRQ